MKYWISILFTGLLFLNLNAQEKIEQQLIGKWIFIKTIDKNNNEVDFVKRETIGEIIANGPDITINRDGTYIKKFDENNSDIGHWRLMSYNEIEFEMVIPMDSGRGELITQVQKLMGAKWRQDGKGNFLDASVDKIVSLNNEEMKIEYEKDYLLIYKKEN